MPEEGVGSDGDVEQWDVGKVGDQIRDLLPLVVFDTPLTENFPEGRDSERKKGRCDSAIKLDFFFIYLILKNRECPSCVRPISLFHFRGVFVRNIISRD